MDHFKLYPSPLLILISWKYQADSLLKPYVKDDSSTRVNPPGQALLNAEGEECYLVEKVIAIKMNKDKSVSVKVRWLGYTAAEDSWEPLTNLDSAIGLVHEFVNSSPRYKRFRNLLGKSKKNRIRKDTRQSSG